MARWSSTTWEQYVAAFRSGARRGRISWLQVLLNFSQIMVMVIAVNVWRLALSHNLDQHFAIVYLRQISVAVTVMALLLAFFLRRSEPERVQVFLPSVLTCMMAATVLVLCMRNLG